MLNTVIIFDPAKIRAVIKQQLHFETREHMKTEIKLEGISIFSIFSAMSIQSLLTFFVLVSVFPHWTSSFVKSPFSGVKEHVRSGYKLSKPLIGDDGRIYVCSESNLLAFESNNGSILWTVPLNSTCDYEKTPVHGGRYKIYLVAANRILGINFPKGGAAVESAAQLFLDPNSGQDVSGEIVGFTVSTTASSMFINIRNKGLFAYMLTGQLLWSAQPVLYRYGYRQGCTKNITDCYFTSVPVIDRCEASIYISNSEGELYSLSVRSPYFKWIQDLSSYDKTFTITAGNNGRLYVTVPARALVLALDVTTGDILWKGATGPLSREECAPLVNSNGWISIGSLDGFLYSFSPTGGLKKYSRRSTLNSVIQVSPVLECSGYGVYLSLTEMDGKSSHTTGDYTYVSAMKPKNVQFTMLVPATGSIYWSESYTGRLSSLLLNSDLKYFLVDERILLAFIAASKTGNPLQCRTRAQKLASSCSQAKPKYLSIYTGNERAIMLFLLFESVLLVVLAGLVRFCFIFWSKKKLQGTDLGSFLEKRRSLQVKKKEFTRTITELEKKAAQEAVAKEVLEKLGDAIQEREVIKRNLSTTYSLGRDTIGSKSKSLLPLHNGKMRSYSFQSAKKESVTIFHTLTDTSSYSSAESSSESEPKRNFLEDKESAVKRKGKTPIEEVWSTSDDDVVGDEKERSPLTPSSASKVCMNPLFFEDAELNDGMECKKDDKIRVAGPSMQNRSRHSWLKRRTLSSTN